MNKLVLTLLSTSTVFSSLLSVLAMVNPAHAAEPFPRTLDALTCQQPALAKNLVCMRLSQAVNVPDSTVPASTEMVTFDNSESGIPIPVEMVTPDDSAAEPAMLEFTEEESDAAIAQYGCDCIVCINSIRQMRGMAPIS